MMIGVDGATFDLIGPWVKAGVLPTFRRLMSEGTSGPLQSVVPPVTPAAWSTLATGMNPGKHGLFDFYGRRSGSYETFVVNATHRHGVPLWVLLNRAGYRTTVFNVPASYPPEPVVGSMVSGLLTPPDAQDAAYPVELLAELRSAVPDFSFYPPGIFSEGAEAAFVEEVLAWDRMTFRAAQFLMQREDWDFSFVVFSGTDIVSHFMWKHMATPEGLGSGAASTNGGPLASAIQNVYRQMDSHLAQLLNEIDDETYVVVVSDHGFGPLDHYIHLNAWLAGRGYIKFKRTPVVLLKRLLHRLGLTPLAVLNLLRALRLGGRVQQTAGKHNAGLKSVVKQAFLSLADVDWSATTAYSTGYGGPIFVNLAGREPQGIVAPGAEYEALLERITADLNQLRDPATGEPFVGEIGRACELYVGPYVDRAPDLQFAPRNWRAQGYGVHEMASRRWLEPSPDRSGTHRMNGILLLRGPGIRGGHAVEEASLCDVAPTVLALMGVPVPMEMDGRVLSAALTEEFHSQLPVQYAKDAAESPVVPGSYEMTPDEEEIIKSRLEALGYWS